MKKTYRQLFALLPEPYASQAVANVEDEEAIARDRSGEDFRSRLDRAPTLDTLEGETDLSTAIAAGFDWRGSPEGWDYWNAIEGRAARGEFADSVPV